MDNIKNDDYYIKRIIIDIDFIIKHTKGIKDTNDLKANEVLVDSILFRLIQISENISRISSSIKESNRHIPWISIKGFRNRIVHEYGNFNLTILYGIVSRDIYDLKELFSIL